MNCRRCGREMRIGTEQVGIDNRNLPIIHRFAYCDTCMEKTDLDINHKNQKKESTLSIVACVLAFFTVTFFFGLICGMIDLCMNDKNYSHKGSWFAVIFGIIIGLLSFFMMFQ